MSTEELLDESNKKLDKIIGLLAVQGKDEDKQIKVLVGLGFTSKEVGVLIGKSAGAIRKITMRSKKSAKKKVKK